MGVGMGAAEKAVERSQSRTGDGSYLPGIYWKDDKKDKGENFRKVVRFLTDDVITAGFYNYVQGGPKKEDGSYGAREFIAPATLTTEEEDGNGNVRNVPIWSETAGEKDFFKENNIQLPNYQKVLKPAKPQSQTVGLAVLREEYKVSIEGTDRKKTATRDLKVKREWKDKDGVDQSAEGLFFGIIKQGHKNFWSTLVGYYNKWGTICDRDYEIIRQGNGTDTTYIIIPLDVDPELDTPEKVEERYFVVSEKDGKRVVAAGSAEDGKCPMTLKDWCVPKAKYDAAKEWFWHENSSAGSAEGKGAAPSTEAEHREAEKSEPVRTGGGSADSLRAELEGYANTGGN